MRCAYMAAVPLRSSCHTMTAPPEPSQTTCWSGCTSAVLWSMFIVTPLAVQSGPAQTGAAARSNSRTINEETAAIEMVWAVSDPCLIIVTPS